mgnify:FL=1|tara:strand:- start:104 stop:346 length:243 start_codon:yes stop_codon:yes gene_type:complete
MVLKRCFIYRDNNLPYEGWFKACFICYTVTAQLALFNTVERRGTQIERVVYMCPDCKRILKKDDKLRTEYEKIVRAYLND